MRWLFWFLRLFDMLVLNVFLQRQFFGYCRVGSNYVWIRRVPTIVYPGWRKLCRNGHWRAC